MCCQAKRRLMSAAKLSSRVLDVGADARARRARVPPATRGGGVRAQRSPTGGTKQRRGDEVTRRKVAQAARRSRCVCLCVTLVGARESGLAGWLALVCVSPPTRARQATGWARHASRAKAKGTTAGSSAASTPSSTSAPKHRVSHSPGGQPQPGIDRSRGIFLPCGRRCGISVLEFRGDGSSRVFGQRQAGRASIRALFQAAQRSVEPAGVRNWEIWIFLNSPAQGTERGPMAASGMGELKARSSSHHHQLAGSAWLGWAGLGWGSFALLLEMIGNRSRLLIQSGFTFRSILLHYHRHHTLSIVVAMSFLTGAIRTAAVSTSARAALLGRTAPVALSQQGK